MNNNTLHELKGEDYFDKEKELLCESFQLKKVKTDDFYEAQNSLNSNSENQQIKIISDSILKEKSNTLINSNDNLEDSSTILSICNDIVKKNNITNYQDLNYDSNSFINNENANLPQNKNDKRQFQYEKIIEIKADQNCDKIKAIEESSISSSNNFVEINISPGSQLNNQLNQNIINTNKNDYKNLENYNKEIKIVDNSIYQEIPDLNLSKKKSSFNETLKSKASKNSIYQEDEIKVYEDCEEVIVSNSHKSIFANIKHDNSDNFADNENEINNLLSNEENFDKSANENSYNKENLDKQIELDREEYLMNKLEELKEKVIISDEKIICAECRNEVNLEDLLNNEECKYCIKNNKKIDNAQKQPQIKITEKENIINENKQYEKFFSNEEKDEIKLCSQNEYSYSSEMSFESSEEEEKVIESKYKFIIDKDFIRARKSKDYKNFNEIEDFINKKKWNSGKNNNLINILNIKKSKQANKNKKDEEYFVNYIKDKLSKNNINEENSTKSDIDSNKIKNKDNSIINANNSYKDGYNESEILDCSSPNIKLHNENGEFTINTNQNKEGKIINIDKQNEILKKSLKESSFKSDISNLSNNINKNFNSKNKNFLDNLSITGEMHKSERNKRRISFDIYPKSTKEIANLNFAKYKKENDNKLLKKILKISKMKELVKKSKFDNSDSISNIKVDNIKKILKNAKNEKAKKIKLKKIKKIEDEKGKNQTTDSNMDNSKSREIKKDNKKNGSVSFTKNKEKLGEDFKKKLYSNPKDSDEADMNKFGLCTWCCKDSNRKGDNNCLIF